LNAPRHSPHDDEMLTMAQRATVGAWYDSAGKIVALIGGTIVIVVFIVGFVAWMTGGIRIGSQVETETLAQATKAANDTLAGKVGSVDEKVNRVEAIVTEIKKQYDLLPVMAQRLSDHEQHLNRLDAAVGLLNDRISNVSQNTNDRITNDEKAAANLEGRLTGQPPQVRQPGH
jgi:hypothetical protein